MRSQVAVGPLPVLGAVASPSPRAEAATIFDFSRFPDSAGCSDPGSIATCDPDWVENWEGGVNTTHVQTIDGLTLTLSTVNGEDGVDWGWIGDVINCGNQEDWSPYLADFSKPLSAAQVDLLGAINTCGCGDEFPDPILYYLDAYSGPQATGTLLGSVAIDASLGPATLALNAPGDQRIRSITFGATTVDNGESGGPCTNLGIADNLVVQQVPEPAGAVTFATGLLLLGHRLRPPRRGRLRERRPEVFASDVFDCS